MKVLKRLLVNVLAVAIMAVGMTYFSTEDIEAANKGTATLRILSTTDLHGQAGIIDYHKASDNNTGSLAHLQTLIKESKNEIKNGNTLLVDSGDTAFGYIDNKILDGELDYEEYMYSTMKYMGYDAITLGNHDFEFGIDFLEGELEDAGMKNNVVLANIFDAKTGKGIWAGSKIITKSMTTTKGEKVDVKIGVIGVTPPLLIDTIVDHTDDLIRQDMVESVKSQVKVLKNKKADVIVVLAHSGVGNEEYTDSGEAAAYEISKIDGVDVVCAGHTHVNFPSNDPKVLPYFDMAGVDASGIMNGTAVVQTANAGAALGQTDIKLKFVNDKVKVVSKKVQIKKVNENTEADSKIKAFLKKYDTAAKEFYAEKIADVSEDSNGYFGMLEDTGAISLANEVKTRFALNYIRENPKYEGYKIVSASSYNMTGQNSADDYVNIKGKITEKDLLNIQQYNNEMVYLFSISGKKLRELMEYSAASIYALPGGDGTFIIADEYNKEWSGLKVFDGVEYTIDTTKAPKYDAEGNVINANSSRITRLTINGQELKDDDKILAVLDRTSFSKAHPILGNMKDKSILMKRLRPNELFSEYIKDGLDANNQYNLTYDNNWKLIFDDSIEYTLRSSSKSGSVAIKKNWYRGTTHTEKGYNYYKAAFKNLSDEDVSGPFLTYLKTKTSITGNPYDVMIYATDKSGVKEVRVAYGRTDASAFSSAKKVEDGKFTVDFNGGYTIIAEDEKGNMSVRYFTVRNIKPGCVEEPTVSYFSNYYKSILGTAQLNTTVYVDVEGVVSSAKTKDDGTYKIAIPYCPRADKEIKVWAVDEAGVSSEKVRALAVRVGGNQPQATINNKECIVKGVVNDDKACIVVAMDEENIYYPKNANPKLVTDSTVDELGRTLVKCKYTTDGKNYKLYLPGLTAGTILEMYTIDWCARDGRETFVTIEEVAPNMPIVTNKVREGGKVIKGYVPDYEKECTIIVKCGDKRFTTTTDYDGTFELDVKGLKEGDKLAVYAVDRVDGEKRTSKKGEATVLKKKEKKQTDKEK